MKNSPAYTIRTRPEAEQPRSEAPASVTPRQPKIIVNTPHVPVIQTEAGNVKEERLPATVNIQGKKAEEVPTETEEKSTPIESTNIEVTNISDIPHIEIEEIEAIGFTPGKKTLFPRRKWTGYTFNPPKNIFRLSAVVGGGIAVGLLLGYVVLHTFTLESTPPAGKAPSALNQTKQKTEGTSTQLSGQTQPGQAQSGQAGTSAKTSTFTPAPPTTPATKSLSVTLPVVPLYMIQAGVFSTKAGAQQELNNFQQKGWPAYMEEEAGKYTLFLGVSASRDDVLALAEVYRAANQAVYIKEKSLPAGTVTLSVPTALPADSAGEIQKLGQAQAQLFQTVSVLIGEGFKDGKIAPNMLDKLLAQHKEVLQQGRSAAAVLGEQPKANLQNALNEMTTAVTALQQFANQPNRTFLWQAEENMLQFISSYKRWQQSVTG
jgi:hypothetical protein